MDQSSDHLHFDGSGDLEVVEFLFYVENYMEPENTKDEKESAVMTRPRGSEFHWFFPSSRKDAPLEKKKSVMASWRSRY